MKNNKEIKRMEITKNYMKWLKNITNNKKL